MNKADYDLKELFAAADKACEIAYENRNRMPDSSVNWGDYHCASAERIEDQDGCISYRVQIEEASPDNYEVQKYMGERLAEMGFPDVEVVTEW